MTVMSPNMTRKQVAEAFARFAAAREAPETELEFRNPYTLLVAVALSAQATDVGVNKATGPLFEIADTPEAMVALGEDKLREAIRTIGLYRTKAKNVIALSRMLIERHGGAVPRDRAALEALPGVGRKDGECGAQQRLRRTHHRRRYAIFSRLGNRTGMARGKTPLAVEERLLKGRPRRLHAPRASLVDPARTLCLQGAQARLRRLRDPRPLPLPRQDRRLSAPIRRRRAPPSLPAHSAAACSRCRI